jgi:hypothetical protein
LCQSRGSVAAFGPVTVVHGDGAKGCRARLIQIEFGGPRAITALADVPVDLTHSPSSSPGLTRRSISLRKSLAAMIPLDPEVQRRIRVGSRLCDPCVRHEQVACSWRAELHPDGRCDLTDLGKLAIPDIE